MCIKVYRSAPGLRLSASSDASSSFHPIAPWLPALPIRSWQHDLLITGVVGSFQARPAFQVASVRPENPSDPAADGFSWVTTEGWTRISVSPPNLGTRMFWRPGIMVQCQSGGSFGEADVELHAQVDTQGEFLGTGRVEVQPMNDSNTTVPVYPITEWFPTVNLKNVKTALMVQNNFETTVTRLYYRAANDLGQPETDWTTLEAGVSAGAGSSERNTGEVALTTTRAWGQLGIGAYKTSGNPGRCIIHTASATIRN